MYIIASDCVYGDKSSAPLADLLQRLLAACPHATVLLAYEQRPLHSVARAAHRDFSKEFFTLIANMPLVTLDMVLASYAPSSLIGLHSRLTYSCVALLANMHAPTLCMMLLLLYSLELIMLLRPHHQSNSL